jgi:hypothetical protein
VRVAATYVGLAAILMLFGIVMWNDFWRFVWPIF